MDKISRFDELVEYISQQGWSWEEGKSIPYGRQILVSDRINQVPVDYYPKREKLVVGGSDCSLQNALRQWANKEATTSIADFPIIEANHIGLDESGKGDWFGPIVIAAVYVDENTSKILKGYGVKDSKQVNPSHLRELAAQILQVIPQNQRYIRVVLPEEYNQLYSQYNNVNILLASIYAEVAFDVWQHCRVNHIVCDQFSQKTERLEEAFLTKKDMPAPLQWHHGESLSIAVAAASILATDAFTSSLEQLAELAGLTQALPKGASDVKLLSSKLNEIISRHGMNSLGQYVKLHFKPIQELVNQDDTTSKKLQPAIQVLQGETITVEQSIWQLQFHPGGFWRFRFTDGGILDWYEGSTGKLDVRGKESSPSYILLREKAHGKTWTSDIEAIKERLNYYFSDVQRKEISRIAGVGWTHRDTLLGSRFDFTDGAVLQHYRGTGKLFLQGRPTETVKQSLNEIINFRIQSLDELTALLKNIFPDWRLGETMQTGPLATGWQPLDDALGWSHFWDSGRELRRAAANSAAPCQREFIEDWSSVLLHHDGKRHLLAHAPTGLGKTISSLISVLAWIAQSPERRKVFYVVNRVTQHENPIRELKSGLAGTFESRTGQRLRVVDLVGRSHLCIDPYGKTLIDTCRDSRDNADFHNLPDTVLAWQEVQDHVGHDGWCPYHFLQGLMQEAHIIICDYWWVFTEAGREALSRRHVELNRHCVVIVDEAHNLPLRIRGDWEVDLSLTELGNLINQSPVEVQICLQSLIAFCHQILDNEEETKELSINQVLEVVGGDESIQSALQSLLDMENETDSTSASHLLRLLRALGTQRENIVIFLTKDLQENNRFVCKLIDPSFLLHEAYSLVTASLSMSGTLAAPTDNVQELLYQVPLFGLPLQETLVRKYASPFSLNHQRWIYNTDAYGILEERGKYISDYARHIIEVGKVTPGITAVFLNSYDFLNEVHGYLQSRFPDEANLVLRETTGDDAIGDVDEYEQRLHQLVTTYGRGYLFAVYQGKLSEGANFSGNLIKSVICVSIPMEYPSPYHERLRTHYEELFKSVIEITKDNIKRKAKEYALDRYALSLVLQSCGRGIRSETDQCAFVLLDKRYDEYVDKKNKRYGYDWRRFLMPRPYNLSNPSIDVKDFHSVREEGLSNIWDPAILAACRSVES